MALPGTGRREARERALHLLYEAGQRGVDIHAVLDEQVLDPAPFTVELVAGIGRHRAELDAVIADLASGWPLERMPTMDRLIMEIGAYELAHRPDVPTAVVLNEATELANTYSTDESGRFVNGVLAAAADRLRG